MSVDQRMNYTSMRAMAKAFNQAAQQLEATMQEMAKAAKLMEEGALQGDGGQQFSDAINSKLRKRLEALRAKMLEMRQDIHKNIEAMGEAVDTAEDRFEN